MQQLNIMDVPPWFLSGQPVVRLKGRDFEQTVKQYTDWLKSLAYGTGLELALLELPDPPGVVMQTYITGQETPQLRDPLIKVTKITCGWLFCPAKSCRNRVDIPGLPCEVHR